jgi:hypothetical protein
MRRASSRLHRRIFHARGFNAGLGGGRLDMIVIDLREFANGVAIDVPGGSACRKSNPDILMMETAEDRPADDIPGPLGAGRDRRILVQMSARGVVVIFVRQEHVAQMAFAEHHDMIDAFPAD